MKIRIAVSSLYLLVGVVFGLGAPTDAYAQCVPDKTGSMYCPPAGSNCVKDPLQNIRCSTPDGGIVINRFQEPVCGPGQCASNPLGEVSCSSTPKGYASVDALGKVVCTGGCVAASASACVTPSR